MQSQYEDLEEELKVEKKNYQKEIDKLSEQRWRTQKEIDELSNKANYYLSKSRVNAESRSKVYRTLEETTSQINYEYKKVQRKLDEDFFVKEKEYKKKLNKMRE